MALRAEEELVRDRAADRGVDLGMVVHEVGEAQLLAVGPLVAAAAPHRPLGLVTPALLTSPDGERLAAYALDSRRRLDEFLRGLGTEPPTLTLAAGRGTPRWVLGPAIRRISDSGRTIRMITSDRDGALAALATGRADLAVLAYDPPPPQLGAAELAAYPQVLVVGVEHPLAGRAYARLRDLDGLELVVPPAGRPHRRALDRALLDAAVSWQVAAEVDGWDLLVHLAGLGLGAAVVNGCVPLPAKLVGVP